MTNEIENNYINVKPNKDRLINLISSIQSGEIKIPIFQRDFVWRPQQMLELFDSILKGYPIGSLLLWRPDKEFKTKEYIGPYRIRRTAKDIQYVLDGFQRLSTLFGCLTNPFYFEDDEMLKGAKEYNIFYNLSDREFTYIKNKNEKRYYYIPLYKIIDTFEFLDFIRQLEYSINDKNESNRLIKNAKEISKTFYDYEIPFVEIKGGDIKSAVEIFSRINSTGTEISQDFMLSALSYNPNTDFLFSEKITDFLNHLSIYNFENLKRDTILNCISTRNKIYFDVKVEELLKQNLEELTVSAFYNIEKSIKFLYIDLCVLDVRLLPYPTQLIFIADYFRINHSPTAKDLELLKIWFWTTSYSNYFTIYSLSQQREAYGKFLEFARGSHDNGLLKIIENFEAADFPIKLNFTGVRTKTLQLFMINHSRKNMSFVPRQKIIELFVFGKKDRSPGNMILLTTEEIQYYNIELLINEAEDNLLLQRRFFLNPFLIGLYRDDDASSFIAEREREIMIQEKLFVENLDIIYDEYSY